MTPPRAAVVIPCFDGEQHLAETLAAALGSTGIAEADLEIIVADDGSTDRSVAIAEGFGPRVRVERLAHGGAPRARNHGLRLATAPAIVFLDADDVLAPDTIASSLDALALAKRPERTLVASRWVDYLSGTPRPRAAFEAHAPYVRGPDALLRACLERKNHPVSALLWPTAFVRELGGWDESLTKHQDVDLMLRAAVAGVDVVEASPREPVLYRHHGRTSRSISNQFRPSDIESCARVLDRLCRDLARAGRFESQRVAIARAYHAHARLYYWAQPERARELDARARSLAGLRAISGSWSHRLGTIVLGLERKEQLAAVLAKLGAARRDRRGRPGM